MTLAGEVKVTTLGPVRGNARGKARSLLEVSA